MSLSVPFTQHGEESGNEEDQAATLIDCNPFMNRAIRTVADLLHQVGPEHDHGQQGHNEVVKQ